MTGGFSNENFALDCGSYRWLLRKTPVITSHQSAHNVLREYRVLRVLQDTRVRVPRIVVSCDDRTVLGTPFFIMDRISGAMVDRQLPALYTLAADSRLRLAQAMIDVLIALHQQDWRALGMEYLGRPDAFLERQVDRWLAQYRAIVDRYGPLPVDLGLLLPVADWLRSCRPPQQLTVLLHGDFHLGNLLFSHQLPVRALALVDWELTTIGDPLLDLGSALLGWFYPAHSRAVTTAPTMQSLMNRYAASIHVNLQAMNYYLVLAAWKRAIILASRYANLLSQAGQTEQSLREFGELIEGLLARARQLSRL